MARRKAAPRGRGVERRGGVGQRLHVGDGEAELREVERRREVDEVAGLVVVGLGQQAGAEQQGKRVYFVGARQAELDLFISKIKSLYPQLTIAGYHNGYFDSSQAEAIQAHICDSEADILIVGLGAGLQEQFEQDALRAGFRGVAFTCGGFIRQEALATRQYYPALINRLHLRAFYRMYREPHTIKRYLIDYPNNFVHLLALIASRKVAISVEE